MLWLTKLYCQKIQDDLIHFASILKREICLVSKGSEISLEALKK